MISLEEDKIKRVLRDIEIIKEALNEEEQLLSKYEKRVYDRKKQLKECENYLFSLTVMKKVQNKGGSSE